MLVIRCMIIFLVMSGPACYAAIDAYAFPNGELRVRYYDLIEQLRCPQCLNTNLAGSDAMIAQDLRREVHRMILEGQTDAEILDFMHHRYGDFVLYKPRFNSSTWILWLAPAFVFVLAIGGCLIMVRRRQNTVGGSLSDLERDRLEQLLKDET
ncbi:MAG: cytochrome c-type biogenesis protein CcmH [Gammaproteobacteria bacterium]|jgi:cytochrome c-type biogenesis protein CcmH|nr:cytochrome c-type biogenesis protein CcmH [Gammaproteobacteria bacterium]MBT5203679.1 cytochrome c-type biogenesis protein CcmH [Gammaproteobacteria bacterium]MBT6245093.1 cytochrome c-type biogenesis protein CcmH [Gammaproteobacteria bacterium]